MTDIEEFKLSSYVSIKELSCTTINQVSIVKSPWDSKLYIQRTLLGDKRPVYALLQKHSPEGVPKIQELIYDGNTYIIEEYINGTLLSKLNLSETKLYPILTSILHILHNLHQLDIIHRDIKADNIIITQEGTPVLLDFAIAKIDYHDGTIDEDIIGTIGNAAPEQFGLAPTDRRSDLFSFGRMCHNLLSSMKKPHTAQRKLWEEIIVRCTNFDPEQRFQSANEILDRLEHPNIIFGASRKRIVSFKNPLPLTLAGVPPFYAPCMQLKKRLERGFIL